VTTSARGSLEAPPAYRRVRQDLLRFSRAGISVRNAARMAVGTTISLVVGQLAGSWASGAAAAGGALAVGIASVVPSPRPRVGVLTSTAIGMAIATFVGSVTSGYAPPHIVVGAVVAFGCGLLVGVEPAFGAIAVNTLIAFLVYGRFAGTPLVAARTAGFVVAGGAFQVLLISFARHRPDVGRALAGLSRAYSALAELAARLQVDASSLPAADAIDAAAADVEFSLLAGRATDAWTSLASEAHRIRLELLSLASARSASEKLESTTDGEKAAFDRLSDATAEFLRLFAGGLSRATIPRNVEEALARVEAVVGEVVERGLRRSRESGARFGFVRAATAAQALAGQLRAVTLLMDDAVSVRRPRPHAAEAVLSARRVSRRGVRSFERVTHEMRANLTPRSDAFRHALRLAAVVTVATVVTHTAHLGRGYWLAMTAAIVLRPDFSATFTRGLGRALGTLVGVGVATALTVGVHPSGWLLVVFTGCFVWLAGTFFNASYLAFSVAVTGVVVFLLAGLDPHESATASDRLIETVLGAALALLAYVVWPAWGRRPAADALADLAEATHDYVVSVLRSYVDPAGFDPAGLSSLSRAVRLARTNAESAVTRSLADPGRLRVDARKTASMLAALRRLSIAAHTLRLQRPAEPLEVSTSVFGALVEGIDRELGDAAARLRFGRVVRVHEPLRERQRALSAVLAVREGRTAVLLSVETDEIVDATNSLNAVLDRGVAEQ